jgi:hypothetical protein
MRRDYDTSTARPSTPFADHVRMLRRVTGRSGASLDCGGFCGESPSYSVALGVRRLPVAGSRKPLSHNALERIERH